MATRTDRDRRATSQRTRRMARRQCGHCGEPAEFMIPWGIGQTIPICRSCHTRLNAVASPVPYCSFDEVGPVRRRSTARSAAIPERRDRPEDDSQSGGILRKIWDWVMEE